MLASFGHVRDLPAKGRLGRCPRPGFRDDLGGRRRKSAKRLNDIAEALKDADELILATDPDREGEAISWHVLEVLKDRRRSKDKTVERVVFNAITKQAVLEAMQHPRQIDGALVDAYLARRALDYLVGFTLSPVLWRKLPGARSAGRVQSVALRLVVRPRERDRALHRRRNTGRSMATLATPQRRRPSRRASTDARRQEARAARHRPDAEAADVKRGA
ncbi:MAG: toprim domain-containing protein [Rhodopseudomonas palustris]|nr:toprim domain-containing protein [Rhodopseudomonas palustris]